ncbi:peptidoglycan DD-metalloendopeptidase family protein [Calothrix sp. PCC 6303]|uniref:peptidoglycan DD-metalloendopeptidase family protein n=1 Tax=Calothrix sp. PCC 6303 TaxID=1170562 RepID=UPI000686565F|nr:peptidoglycan DD-metalloendopeptidase family protein [Calothrix sp. PCC 6303]
MIENTPSEDAPVKKVNIASLTGKHRVRKQAAMIGLAISMGATSLLVTRQSDQAQAAEPAGNQNTASATSANNTEIKLATKNKLESSGITSVKAPESPSPIILEPTAISQVPGLGAKWQVATSEVAFSETASITAVNATSATKGERIAGAIAKIQSAQPTEQTVAASAVTQLPAIDNADFQLKAQQELAVNRLKQKSSRLRASLAELRSGETKELSETTTINANNDNQQSSSVGTVNNINLVPEQQKNILKSQMPVTTASKVYEVKSGDTLATIANNYGTSVSELVKANNLNNPNQLKISQKLNVPVAEKNTVVTTVDTPVSASSTTDVKDQLVGENKDVTSPSTTASNLTAIQIPTVPTAPAVGVGGDSPVPKVFAEMQQATRRGAKTKNLKEDPGLRSLQADIERLRQKYRDQQSGISSNQSIQQRNTQNVVIPVPTYKQNTVSVPTVPRKSRPSNFAVPIPVPKPMAPSYTAQPINPEWSPSRNQRSTPIPVPTGVTASEALSNMRGTSVSPQLPPLAAVDRYLPRAVDNNTSPAINPGVFTPGVASSYIWPAKGVLTSGFGRRWGRAHRGIDVANSTGTPIYASAPGVVEKSGWNNGGYGNLVDIRHPDGSLTRYAHNSKLLVRPGQQVQQGETIALMGSTGFSTGPHTHFEIHPSGKGAVNPIALLPARL